MHATEPLFQGGSDFLCLQLFWRGYRNDSLESFSSSIYDHPSEPNFLPHFPHRMSDETLNQALEQQQDLVEANLPTVFAAYDEAQSEGINQPLILLVDCEDELGGQIARGWLGDEQVDNAIAIENQSEENESLTTLFALPIEWQESREELSNSFPYLSNFFGANYPQNGLLVLSITAGGASGLSVPFDARS